MGTKIEWTRNEDGSQGKSWNPIRARRKSTGKVGHYCQKISPGCANCYANAMNQRCSPDGLVGIGNGVPYAVDKLDQVEMFLDEKVLLAPLKWKKPTRIFVCSMTDLFGSWVDDLWLDRIYAVAALCPQHTFIILTKRPERRMEYLSYGARQEMVGIEAEHISGFDRYTWETKVPQHRWKLPLLNVWECVSVVNQEEADRLVPILLQTPAAVRGVSAEPLLAAVDLRGGWLHDVQSLIDGAGLANQYQKVGKLDWVICGGESGPKARPMHPDWARTMRDQCAAAGVPFFFKQWGEFADLTNEENGSALHKKSTEDRIFAASGEWFGAGYRDGRRGNGMVDGDWKEKGGAWMARVGKRKAGRLLDGVEHEAFPEARP